MAFSEALRLRVQSLAHFTETWLLSLMYLWQAWQAGAGVLQVLMSSLPQGGEAHALLLVWLIREIDLGLVFLLIGALLLCKHAEAEGPRDLKEVLVPLAVTLFFLAYRLPPLLPLWLQQPLAPVETRVICAIVALFLGAAGSAVAVWGVVSLGRSFGIFVAVRPIVLAGPYRYVRHPIYAGYLLVWIGLVLANLSLAIILLVAIHTGLMIYRARLEERRLAAASPAYRDYLEKTGFLWPRLDPVAAGR